MLLLLFPPPGPHPVGKKGQMRANVCASLLFSSPRQTLALLNQFKTKLTSAISEAPEQQAGNQEEEEEEDGDDDSGW